MNVPTAIQFTRDKGTSFSVYSGTTDKEGKDIPDWIVDTIEMEVVNNMIEFAKLHVLAALEAVYSQNEEILDAIYIMNSYPLSNIK